jgi:hypothetical protein
MPDVKDLSELLAKHGILIVLVLVLVGFMIWLLVQYRRDSKEDRGLFLATLDAEREARTGDSRTLADAVARADARNTEAMAVNTQAIQRLEHRIEQANSATTARLAAIEERLGPARKHQ